jgi:hypothetical protein
MTHTATTAAATTHPSAVVAGDELPVAVCEEHASDAALGGSEAGLGRATLALTKLLCH